MKLMGCAEMYPAMDKIGASVEERQMSLYSMNNLTNYALTFALAGSLVACGGEGNSPGNSSGGGGDIDVTPAVSLYSQDTIEHSATNMPITVDLSHHLVASDGGELRLDSIESLSAAEACANVSIDGVSYRLPAVSQPVLCEYRYTVEHIPTGQQFSDDTMVSRLIVQEMAPVIQYSAQARSLSIPSSTLAPMHASISSAGDSITLNLASHFATSFPQTADGESYILSDNILVLGNGSIERIPATGGGVETDKFIYNSSSGDPGGVTRILYSLTDDFDLDGIGDFQVGAIDISVSADGSNQMPVATSFIWDNAGADIKTDGTTYTIDVSKQLSSDCTYANSDPTTNSCLFDADGDTLQLTGVYSYDANASVTSPTVLDSTSFDVSFAYTGVHDITYYVSDHYGGFAMGTVRVDIPHNSAPVFKGPLIVEVEAGQTATATITSSDLIDLDGDTVTLQSVSAPHDGGTVVLGTTSNAGSADITFTYTPKTVTEGIVNVKASFSDGLATTEGDIIFLVNPISTLSEKPLADRSFIATFDPATSPTQAQSITIDTSTLFDGLAAGEVVTVKNEFYGNLLGTVSATGNPGDSDITYTPSGGVYGVDDFAFTITTDLGNQITSYIKVTIGDPPELEITALEAIEGSNDLVTAQVTCEYCDVTSYEYTWLINGEIVSNDPSFTITDEQRPYAVTLLVVAYDVFGQSTYKVEMFDLFKLTLGTFDQPAESCDAIFEQYNSPYAVVADDGEYWIQGTPSKFKTQCDMVSYADSVTQNKATGGYTLIWSYSAKTNLTRFGGDTTVFSQTGKNLHWGSTSYLAAGVGYPLTLSEDHETDYNNFRISQTDADRLNGRIIRLNYTSDPSVETIDSDPDGVVEDWSIETLSADSVSLIGTTMAGTGSYRNQVNGWTGTIKGMAFSMDERMENISFNGIIPSRVPYAYIIQNSSNHPWMMFLHVPLDNGIGLEPLWLDTVFGGYDTDFSNNQADGADLFFKCTNPTSGDGGYTGLSGPSCRTTIGGAATYHDAINNGEGYVAQWWVK
ncbi:Ig-like domain-containing protein [Vibrio hippocampi]|uniref:Ig-like domain-containing protein n=1 Tax=Vibrio hippocampi TaxID=654686 RepID=A0ABN8DP83_9VIBR|nr:hypothetical protein [Vibrio hippocampi]CAH0529871.1 hypothetical protein VHP8226_03627 [Vibrio hippocampi]